MRILPFPCFMCTTTVWPWQRLFHGGKFAGQGHRDCTIEAEIQYTYELWDGRVLRTDIEELFYKYVT